jgi:hypothetical protein
LNNYKEKLNITGYKALKLKNLFKGFFRKYIKKLEIGKKLMIILLTIIKILIKNKSPLSCIFLPCIIITLFSLFIHILSKLIILSLNLGILVSTSNGWRCLIVIFILLPSVFLRLFKLYTRRCRFIVVSIEFLQG